MQLFINIKTFVNLLEVIVEGIVVDLSDKDTKLFLALLEHPLATNDEIAIYLKDNFGETINSSTVSRRIKRLKEEGLINRVQAQPNVHKLDLEIDAFIVSIDDTRWNSNIQAFINFLQAHEYTNFYNSIHGATHGFYVEFYVPAKGKVRQMLRYQFRELKKRKIISEYLHIDDIDLHVGTSGRFNRSEGESNQFNWYNDSIAWDRNSESIGLVEAIRTRLKTFHEPLPSIKRKSILKDLTAYDLAILREITKDASQPQKEILNALTNPDYLEEPVPYDPYQSIRQEFPKSKQTLSRRINEIKDLGLIRSYFLSYDRLRFGLFNQALFIMDNDKNGMSALASAIQDIVPFPCSLNANDTFIVFWIHCPPVNIIQLSDVFSERFSNVKLHLFGRHPASYPFHNKLFDEKTRYWELNLEKIQNMPLKAIDNFE